MVQHPLCHGSASISPCSWLRREEESQKTDVHYRSMDGEGNFNWRLVFPFEYSPFDKMTVVKQKVSAVL